MSQMPSGAGSAQDALTRTVRDHSTMFLIEGVVLLILGALAVMIPPLATLGVTLVLGWLFLISGVMGLIATFWARSAPGFIWSLISALLGIGAGLVLITSPASGAVSLTLILAVFFVIEGVASIMYALDHRRQLSRRWGWMLFSGLIDLGLAAIIVSGLPGTAAWALGLMVGVNLMFNGISLTSMALVARR